MELQKYMRGGLDVSEAEVDSLWTPYADAQRALDAEREKVKGLEKEAERLRIVNRGHINEGFKDMKTIEELTAAFAKAQTDLTQLQALVREIKEEFDNCTHECERCGESDPLTTFDIYRTVVKAATLDATTPAAKGGNGE